MTDPKPPTVESMTMMAHMNCIHSCHDEDPPQERCEKCESVHEDIDALAARVREIEDAWLTVRGCIPQYADAPLTHDGLIHGIRQLAAMFDNEKVLHEKMKRERDEARGENATRKRIIEHQNIERLAIVEEAQRNDLAMRERAQHAEAENARLCKALDKHHNRSCPREACHICLALNEGREGKVAGKWMCCEHEYTGWKPCPRCPPREVSR